MGWNGVGGVGVGGWSRMGLERGGWLAGEEGAVRQCHGRTGIDRHGSVKVLIHILNIFQTDCCRTVVKPEP